MAQSAHSQPDESSPAGPAADRQQLVGLLTGGMAHDFNNILATVLGCLELMQRRTRDPERLEALITRASDAVERAATLTSALVQFSRRQPQPPARLDLNTALDQLKPLIASALGRRVHLETMTGSTLPRIVADPAAVEAAALGLILSVRQSLPEGGTLRIETESLTRPAGQRVRLSVKASGEPLVSCDLSLPARLARAAGADLDGIGESEMSAGGTLEFPAG